MSSAGARTQSASPVPLDAVPVADGLEVVRSDVSCPASPDRCIRLAVLVDRTSRDEPEAVRAQQRKLEHAGWRRVPVCGSDVLQYEDQAAEREVFVFGGRERSRVKPVKGGEDSSAILRAAVRRGSTTLVLEVADAAPSAPC